VCLESDQGPLSYQDSVLPLNYTRTQRINLFSFSTNEPFILYSLYQDSVPRLHRYAEHYGQVPLNYTRVKLFYFKKLIYF
jgi:hypothetical protein